MSIRAGPCPESSILSCHRLASFGALPSEEKEKRGLCFLPLQGPLPWRTGTGCGELVRACNIFALWIVFLCLCLMAVWWGTVALALTPSLSTEFLLVSITTAVLSESERLLKGRGTEWLGVARPLCLDKMEAPGTSLKTHGSLGSCFSVWNHYTMLEY